MVGQSYSRANSSTGTDDRKGVNYPFCVKCGQKHPLGTAQFPPGDALCAEERVIGGGTASIWVKGVITVVEEVITRGTAPKGTMDRYKAIGSPVRATNSQSL